MKSLENTIVPESPSFSKKIYFILCIRQKQKLMSGYLKRKGDESFLSP